VELSLHFPVPRLSPGKISENRSLQQQPIQAQGTHGFGELVEFDGLGHEAVRADVVAGQAVLVQAGGGQDHHRNALHVLGEGR